MPDSEVFRWAFSLALPAVAGLAGVVLGAWATDRQSRWKLKREAYERLLTTFADAHHAAQKILYLKETAGRVSAELKREFLQEALVTQRTVSGAIALGQLTLGASAAEALNGFERIWQEEGEGALDAADMRLRLAALEKTSAQLIRIEVLSSSV